MSSVFARGLAAATIGQVLIMYNIPDAQNILNIIYQVIFLTIALSSARIFYIYQSKKHKI